MFRFAARPTLLAALAGMLGLIPAHVASATAILPGFDLLHTPAGAATLDITALGVGPVAFQSRTLAPPNPIAPPNPVLPGNTDTIVERLTGLPPGGTGTIDIELVALSLVSVDPVDVGGTLFDVFVLLAAGPPSPGQINVLTNVGGEGNFDAVSDVFFEVTLAEVGNPLNQTAISGQQALLQSTGTGWSHNQPPLHPPNPAYPSGDFYADSPWTFSVTGNASGTISFVSANTVPEPSTFVLAGLGLLGIGWRRRKRT